MERSMPIPFTHGKLNVGLVVTGPLCDSEGAEIILDDMNRRAIHDIMKSVVPALNGLTQSIETGEGTTTTDTILELEILGTQVQLNIDIDLDFVVDADLVRSMVAQYALPDFAKAVVDIISCDMLTQVINDETRVQHKPRQRSSLGDILGGLVGEGALLRVG